MIRYPYGHYSKCVQIADPDHFMRVKESWFLQYSGLLKYVSFWRKGSA